MEVYSDDYIKQLVAAETAVIKLFIDHIVEIELFLICRCSKTKPKTAQSCGASLQLSAWRKHCEFPSDFRSNGRATCSTSCPVFTLFCLLTLPNFSVKDRSNEEAASPEVKWRGRWLTFDYLV